MHIVLIFNDNPHKEGTTMVCSYLNMLFYSSTLHSIGFALAFIWQVEISTVLSCSQELSNSKFGQSWKGKPFY